MRVMRMHSGGKEVLIEELNTKDSYMEAAGSSGITVKSLSGTCVLQTGSREGKGIEMHLSGLIGHVVASTGGAPICCYLPQHASKRLGLQCLLKLQ